MSTYQTGSSLLASGLTYWQAIIVILIGNFLASCFAVLNSVSGAQSHLGFPIVSRSVWGMWGAYFPVLNRILTSITWYGVQAVIGGKMIYVCLRSIWMNLDERIPNKLPAGIGITSAQFLGYFLFNVLCAIFIWFKPGQLRPYFHGASVVVGITLFSLLGWAVGTSDGYGTVFNAKTTISSTQLGWQMTGGVMSVIGSIASGILNQNDFTRFAKKPSHVTYTQAFSFMITSSTMAIIGVVVTAATQERKSNTAHCCSTLTKQQNTGMALRFGIQAHCSWQSRIKMAREAERQRFSLGSFSLSLNCPSTLSEMFSLEVLTLPACFPNTSICAVERTSLLS